ncbi:unnamed protein product [Symbiodinium sp. CCMP2592]|nr:unnamed protein product [Symbiodinium sp. CCMP2592]
MVPSGNAWKGLKTPAILECLKQASERANTWGPVVAAQPKEPKARKPKAKLMTIALDELRKMKRARLEVTEGVILVVTFEDSSKRFCLFKFFFYLNQVFGYLGF